MLPIWRAVWPTGSPTASPLSHPTVLVALTHAGLREALTGSFRQDDCLVLEAGSEHRVLDIVKIHSRRIHVLLLDAALGDPDFMKLLRIYRPDMRILSVTATFSEDNPDALAPEDAIASARQILNPGKRSRSLAVQVGSDFSRSVVKTRPPGREGSELFLFETGKSARGRDI